jgi:hypothetical protein
MQDFLIENVFQQFRKEASSTTKFFLLSWGKIGKSGKTERMGKKEHFFFTFSFFCFSFPFCHPFLHLLPLQTETQEKTERGDTLLKENESQKTEKKGEEERRASTYIILLPKWMNRGKIAEKKERKGGTSFKQTEKGS